MSLRTIYDNPIALTDAYNLSHSDLKCNTDWEVSHVYNRKRGMILHGFREMIERVLTTRITHKMVDQAEKQAIRKGMPFPRALWDRVVDECNGFVPIKIEALPEGRWCPAGTPFAQVSNTEEGFGELVTWFEPIILMCAFASGCATDAFEMRKYLKQKQVQYGFDDGFLWKFHSFGFRGHRSLEDAYWAGTGWNLYLHGTDDFHTAFHTVSALIGSIPALAHKVTQQFDKEFDCFTHAIRFASTRPNKIVALVIDTYDAYRVIEQYLPQLAVYAAERGVHIVLRPDSGDVLEQAVDIYKICQANDFKNVSVIIGEGMSFEQAIAYDESLEAHGVPLNFVFYGIGGGFYRHIDRDYVGLAMKTAYSNGADRMKLVNTAPTKSSIPGAVAVLEHNETKELIVVPQGMMLDGYTSAYQIAYEYRIGYVEPLVQDGDWENTYTVAREQTGDQALIHIHESIKEKVKHFQETYLEEEVA